MDQPLPPDLVPVAEIRAAAARLDGIALRTPLLPFGVPLPGDPQGRTRAWLKPESLQPIGAFKIRGAWNALAALTPEERARGVITHSSGNHAQGVARAARILGIRAVIVMPDDAPAVKVAGVRADGAEIDVVGPAGEERIARADARAAAEGLVLVPSYDDPRIIAGQGTAGLEIAEQLAELGLADGPATVLVPIGGGGLAAGVATALAAVRPGTVVLGVEPELAADPDRGGRDAREQSRRAHLRAPPGVPRRGDHGLGDGDRAGDGPGGARGTARPGAVRRHDPRGLALPRGGAAGGGSGRRAPLRRERGPRDLGRAHRGGDGRRGLTAAAARAGRPRGALRGVSSVYAGARDRILRPCPCRTRARPDR